MTAMSEEGAPAAAVQQFDPTAVAGRYLYEAVAEHLAARIVAGNWPSNAPLPAEGELADQYGVSLGTVRHATRLLRTRGLVVTVQSKGTYVVRKTPLREVVEPQSDSDTSRRTVAGVDVAGTSTPVSIEVWITETGPVTQMRVAGEGGVLLSENFLDDLLLARAHLLHDNCDKSGQVE